MSLTIAADIDELLRFLPLFEAPGREFATWPEPEKDANGVYLYEGPEYAEDVQQFFRLASQPCWCQYGYEPGEAKRMLKDDHLITRANLDEIKTMLTYCVRGERFADGHWEVLLKAGKVQALLRRLAVLAEKMGED